MRRFVRRLGRARRRRQRERRKRREREERKERKQRKASEAPKIGVWGDVAYLEIFERAIARERGEEMGRRERMWSMVQFLESTRDLEGETAEAGVLYGLGSFLICSYRELREPGFRGAGHHAIDSYRGFAYAHPADLEPGAWESLFTLNETGPSETSYRDRAERVLQPFPEVAFHEGWIPEVFDTLDPDARYRFVHIDVDLHDPTYASLDYFFPRVVPGGAIVIDDYGFPAWPGCKTATHAFCEKHGVRVVPLPYGNAVIVKRGDGPIPAPGGAEHKL